MIGKIREFESPGFREFESSRVRQSGQFQSGSGSILEISGLEPELEV